ncbi:hypothetical protein ACB094_09G071400 [Castanea mollissima]
MGTESAPTAAPLLSRITTPKPAKFKDQNTAASKLTLHISEARGHHRCTAEGQGRTESSSWEAKNSCRKFPALLHIRSTGIALHPKCSLPLVPDAPNSNNKNICTILVSTIHESGQEFTEINRLNRNRLVKPL